MVWLTENSDLGYIVPKFDILDISYHEGALKQKAISEVIGGLQNKYFTPQYLKPTRRLEDKCNELFSKFKGKGVMVRSSAVLSEDGDKLSGAGIYDSFEIPSRELSQKTLLDNVLKVYASVDNPKAIEYRKFNGLGDEQMEVIVQELTYGYNGVAMSRLQARAGIKSVSWSDIRGAAVGSYNKGNAEINTALFTPLGKGYVHGAHKFIFTSENTPYSILDYIQSNLLPLMDKIKERYSKEFEIEFVMDPFSENKNKSALNLVQIRPLTNIQDKIIKFPKKKPIMEASFCVGIGEYIGKWINPREVSREWREPKHYAYVAPCLEKTMPGIIGNLGSLFGMEERARDYDKLTPNKKAIVITSQLAYPGMHALNIANEKGIICLAGNKNLKRRPKKQDRISKLRESNKAFAKERLGAALVDLIEFNIPLDKVGPYIHIVSDGLNGRVYQASEEEANEFDKNFQ